MNIGIFTDTYTPQINGVVISIETLAAGLRKKGHNVYIFSPNDPKLKDMPKDKIHEEYAYRLPSVPVPFSPEHRLAVGYYKRMYKKVKELNLDVIHTQTEFSIGILGEICGKKLGIPVIHTYHTMWSDYAHYITRIKNQKLNMPVAKLIQKFSKTFCQHTNAVITPSNKTRAALIKYGVKKPLIVIPTGMNLKPYRDYYSKEELDTIRKDVGISDKDKVVLFIGRIAEEKSIDVIIEEFKTIKENVKGAKLLIVGDGPARKDLEHLTKKLGLTHDVIFAGKKPHEDIAKFYKLGDVFVNASTTETQGLTFIEAMAAGIPVVAKYDDNLKGVIKDDITGSLFKENNEFSTKVIRMLNDLDYRKDIINNAANIANEYSVENFISKVEIAYQSLIFNHTKKIKQRKQFLINTKNKMKDNLNNQ
ncbi:MAG: glycosyltransferase family 4 protein [Clostridia bacterium]|nr:glycosyltransferase family 4 protein [Clostridia bacterium]